MSNSEAPLGVRLGVMIEERAAFIIRLGLHRDVWVAISRYGEFHVLDGVLVPPYLTWLVMKLLR